mgnify:CR=1 FL=1
MKLIIPVWLNCMLVLAVYSFGQTFKVSPISLLSAVSSVANGGKLMQITELRIRKVEDEGKLRAYVTVTFDNCFVVHNVKIIEGKRLRGRRRIRL